MSNSYSPPAGGNGIWLFTLLLWPAFGWLGDSPRRVRPDEPVLAHLGPWVSVVTHATGASIVALTNPLWGLAWALFVALILVRRIGASSSDPVPVRLRDLRAVARSVPVPTWVWAVAVVAPFTMLLPEIPVVTWVLSWPAYAGPYAVMVLAAAAGAGYVRAVHAQRASLAAWAGRFASIIGVTPALLMEEARIEEGTDSVWMTVVPPQAALAYGTRTADELDARVAAVAPAWMLDPTSGPEAIGLVPADAAVAERRANPYVGETLEATDYPREALSFDDLDLS